MKKALASIALAGSVVFASQAQNESLAADDGFGTSSFNTAGGWNLGLTPSAGNTYSSAGYLLRSPASGSAYTFQGDTLTVGGGLTPASGLAFSPVTGNNNSLMFKTSGQTLTVGNLILDAGQIRDGLGTGDWAALNGAIYVTKNGGAFMAQDTNIINSAISGVGTIYIGDNGNGDPGRVIIFTSPISTFAGSIVLNNSGNDAARSRLTFAPGSDMNFNIGNNGVNNSISGQGTLTLGGVFDFNLTLADNTIGDSWSIVSATSVTYDPTFSIDGFVNHGGGIWGANVNGGVYQYNTGTGILSVIPVPEPSTLALGALGVAGLFAFRSRRKA